MSWIYRKADQHQCQFPDLGDAAVNDVWQCDTCTACYKVLSSDIRGERYLKGATPEDLHGLFQSGLLVDP